MKNKALSMLSIIIALCALTLGACSTTEPTPEITIAPALPATDTPEPEPGPITLTDGLGRSITLEKPAQKIVSMAPSNTELLFAIGAGGKLVGRDTFSDYPAEAADVPDIGGGFGELNMETILSAAPDLVLAADLTPPEQIQALEDVGLIVFALPNPLYFDDLYANLATVGQLTGHESEADQLNEQLRARVTAVEAVVAGVSERPLVFYELDASDPSAPWTSGPGTFIDTLINAAGGVNLGADLEGSWVQISIEELLVRDPDVIILGDYTWGGVTPADAASRTGWEALSAIQNEQIFTFDDNLVSRPGPRLVDGLEAMAKLLHPDSFE